MTVEDTSLTLKVLTVNTHKGFTFFNRRFILHELRDAIRATQADVVFLQEVLGSHQRHASRLARWPTTSQYEFLADSIWDDFAYGRNAVYPYGDHGNALLSKFPISRYDNVDVSVGKHEKRGLLHCVLAPPGSGMEIHAICVHLGLREQHRNSQLSYLSRLIDEEVPKAAPLVVAGDFNDWRQRGQNILTRSCGLKEVFRERHGQVARTFPARFPLLRLDRIYVRNIARFQPVALASRPWTHLSDHAPLAVELAV
ncbi:endonuclease/exonuclease/phosphatase family protein [Pusillimonas sp. SM2304]|uniref:endonuclease/exonuclease/phosphatase family protein n=1 Tax=Pusillimonas sp. SM2304 TaxID=3073241 RepID=UPI0028764A42|nr:endonuclease/exonuclease/phosphatase family protein [Pusillimonas sp. SM2304]MDS1141473.1 endonuclease/exonuclease/phosphatase family protein [Pusillimonas sp. SM2304]